MFVLYLLLPLLIATCTVKNIYFHWPRQYKYISITNIKILLFCFLEVNTDICTDNSGSSDLSICQERKRSFHSCILCFDRENMRVLVPIIQRGAKEIDRSKNIMGLGVQWTREYKHCYCRWYGLSMVWWHFPEFRRSCSDQIMLCILRQLFYSAIVLHISQTVQSNCFSEIHL